MRSEGFDLGRTKLVENLILLNDLQQINWSSIEMQNNFLKIGIAAN